MRYLFHFLLLLAVSALSAQVQPPDFLCTRSQMGAEVLTWTNTPNGCGPFEATEIYTANGLNGPFTLLVEITDPAATTFQNPNPAGTVRFYYLRHRYSCPGEAVLNSDTLDNLIPLTPVVSYVSVEDGNILIEWEPSPSPEVSAYIIFEQNPAGNIPLDTVFSGTAYELPVQPGDPPPGERSFLLVAIDPCGNDSPQGRAASPMDLSATGGFVCTETITLEIDQAARETYLPATALELFVSVNGGDFASVGTFPPNAVTIEYNGANDGEQLCFYVEAVIANNGGRARSAGFCQNISFNQPVRDFPLYGVEVNANGELVLQYGLLATQAVPATARLLVTRNNGQTEASDLPGFTFGNGTLVVPAPAEPLVAGNTLRLRVIDDCMREVTTNAVAPVFLTARPLFLSQNQVEWTPFGNNLEGTFTYSVARAFVTEPGAAAGAMFELIAVDTDEVSLTDDTGTNTGIACYQVSVRFIPAAGPAGTSAIFRSNIVCVLPRAEAYIPNAFSPVATQGENRIFLPRFSSPPPALGYLLQVYDRWGGLLFETTDPATGWDGSSRGQPLPAGTFLYQLTFQTPDGQTERAAGTVNLLR